MVDHHANELMQFEQSSRPSRRSSASRTRPPPLRELVDVGAPQQVIEAAARGFSSLSTSTIGCLAVAQRRSSSPTRPSSATCRSSSPS